MAADIFKQKKKCGAKNWHGARANICEWKGMKKETVDNDAERKQIQYLTHEDWFELFSSKEMRTKPIGNTRCLPLFYRGQDRNKHQHLAQEERFYLQVNEKDT